MFDGLDDVDFSALTHAYGPAGQTPGWIHGLIDPDPAVREQSLDAMYGAVHHQGDIYDSTVAALPFLLSALATPGLPGGAGITELVTSIAGGDDGDDFGDFDDAEADDDPEYAEMMRFRRKAHEQVAAAVPGLANLLIDPEAEVRAAAPALLNIPGADPEPNASLFTARLAVETDYAAATALLAALSRIARRTQDTAIISSLLELARTAPLASTAVAALTAAARADHGAVPLGDAADLLERAYAEQSPPAEPAGFTTDTLIGSVRVLFERENKRRRAPHAARMIDSLTDALAGRVPERISILERLLASPHNDIRSDALYGTTKLIERRRGNFHRLIMLTAELLDSSDAGVADQAARLLDGAGPLAAPAADLLAAQLGRIDPLIRYKSGSPGVQQLTDATDAAVLAKAWTANTRTRLAIAESPAGKALATGELRPLFEAELARTARALSAHGWSSTDVINDERLLATCRTALS